MNYEYLLRRIFQVGRYGKKNVDADIYRKLEHAEALYRTDLENIEKGKTRVSNQNIEDLAYECRVECKKVWMIITEAIEKGITKHKHSFTKEEIEIMEKVLIEPKNITKEYIDNVIGTVEKIYVNHKIYPA